MEVGLDTPGAVLVLSGGTFGRWLIHTVRRNQNKHYRACSMLALGSRWELARTFRRWTAGLREHKQLHGD